MKCLGRWGVVKWEWDKLVKVVGVEGVSHALSG